MLFAATLSFTLLGCREDTGTKQGRAPSGGQSGTAKTPGATPEAPSEVGKAPAGQDTGAMGQAVAQQKQQFIANAEKTLGNLEQQAQNLQQTQVSDQDKAKVQQLQQQLQQQIASARQNLTKLRDAPADAWRNMTVAVNDSIQSAQSTLKDLQSTAQGERQVTAQQP